MTDMQKVNLFNYLTNWRIPKWHLNGDGQAGMPAQSGSFHPESWQGCCWHPCVGGLHTCGLAPRSDLPCAFYQHRDRQIKHVHERASTIICYLYTEILEILLSTREDKEHQTQYRRFPHLFSRPWYSQLQGQLSESSAPYLSF